jgi:hypothetical protein
VVVDIVGIKDSTYKHRVTCMPICRRHTFEQCGVGGDAACAYDALRASWVARQHTVEHSERTYRGGSRTAFFITAEGRPWCTRDSQQLAEEVGAFIGFSPSELGGKAFRIGGATDLREVHGLGAQQIVKGRGRWASDVAQLYQRALLQEQLDVSAGAADACGRDMEEALDGWVQPAAYYAVGAAA